MFPSIWHKFSKLMNLIYSNQGFYLRIITFASAMPRYRIQFSQKKISKKKVGRIFDYLSSKKNT